jgi:hypothetical protein
MANLTIKQGDDVSLPLTITEADEVTPVNLTGATLTFHLRRLGGTTDAISPAPTLTVGTPATAGIATLVLTAAQTTPLLGDLVYQFEVELLDGQGKTSTPTQGYVLVEADRG